MQFLRTPDERFANLPDYRFEPNYSSVSAADGTQLRVHHIDEGPKSGEPILCLHGQPSWSFLYRKMAPILSAAGYRVIAPDLIGFGRTDKPTSMDDYTYSGHVDWMSQWLTQLDLSNITLVCQDWGGLIGLRLVGLHPERFARLVVANTGLPDSTTVPPNLSEMLGTLYPQVPTPDAAAVRAAFASGSPGAFLYWVKYASESPHFSVRDVFSILSQFPPDVVEGYLAPFPSDDYIAGARKFPALVPLLPKHQSDREANDRAWKVLEAFEKPVLTAFSDDDPVTRGAELGFQTRIPGARGRAHITIKGGGHFLQELRAPELSEAVIAFMRETR